MFEEIFSLNVHFPVLHNVSIWEQMNDLWYKIAILQLEGQNNVIYVHTAYYKVYKMSLIFPTFASDYNQRKLAISSHHIYI